MENEKPKLDNARRLTGIYFIDLDDKDYKETLKNARKQLERLMAPAMPCKRKAQTSITKGLHLKRFQRGFMVIFIS